jgi:ribosome maturation factor RimP
MSDTELPEKVASLIEPVARAHGLDLVDVEVKPSGRKSLLRLILDRPGGVTVDDLADLSREVGDVLDVHDVMPGGYTLECSSPGINRPLKRPTDFARFLGKSVRLRTHTPIAGARNFAGLLVAADDEQVELEDRACGRIAIPYRLIERAHYEHDFVAELRQRARD